MYVAIKGFVLVAWSVAGGEMTPISSFSEDKLCEAAKVQLIEKSDFKALCLPGSVIAVVNINESTKTKDRLPQEQPNEKLP